MSFVPFPQALVPKRWFTYIILVLFGLTFVGSLLLLSFLGLLFGYCLYFIYKRNTRGHRLYLIYGGLTTLSYLYLQDFGGIALNIVIMFLVFLDFDYIRKYQQTNPKMPTPSNASQYPAGTPTPIYGSNPPVNPINYGTTTQPISSPDVIPTNFCGSCGLKITDPDTKFCQNCGDPIN